MKSSLLNSSLLFCCLLVALSAMAAEDFYPFETDAERERFRQFTYELRCPKCQGQTLAGSDAGVAADLKRELHRLIVEGKTDTEIVDFMVARYGDFVLYNPRVQPNTYIIWFGPLLLLLLAVGVFARIIYKMQQQE